MNVNINPNTLLLLGMSQKQIDKMTTSFGIPSPDFSPSSFPTKIAPSMSEEEYEEAIRAQAREDALSGGYLSKKSLTLKWEYEALSAPDRRGIITSTLQTMARNPLVKSSKLEFADFKDSSNRVVAKYSKNIGWMSIMTQE